MRSGAAIHWFGREDHELPDRRLRCLRFASWPCVHRSRVVSSEGMDRRSRSSGSHICACRCRLCDQTQACDENDRTRDSRVCTIQVGCRRYRLRCWQHRTATTSGRQRLRAWGQQRSCVSILGQATAGRRYGCRPRPDAALIRLEAPVGGSRNQRTALHDWCYLELADLEAEQFNSANDGLWTRGLLIRRRIADDDLAFFTTWCPAGTSIETLVAVEGHRWAIEDSFETAKNEFGLDHNESRSWHGWHRHVSLVMLAFAMMAAIRHRANPPPPKKTKRRPPAKAKAQPPHH